MDVTGVRNGVGVRIEFGAVAEFVPSQQECQGEGGCRHGDDDPGQDHGLGQRIRRSIGAAAQSDQQQEDASAHEVDGQQLAQDLPGLQQAMQPDAEHGGSREEVDQGTGVHGRIHAARRKPGAAANSSTKVRAMDSSRAVSTR
jgi:hypothetical protein